MKKVSHGLVKKWLKQSTTRFLALSALSKTSSIEHNVESSLGVVFSPGLDLHEEPGRSHEPVYDDRMSNSLEVIVSSLDQDGVHLQRLKEDGWWIDRGSDGHEMFVFLTADEATTYLAMREEDRAAYTGWGVSPEEAHRSVCLRTLTEELHCDEGRPQYLVFDNGNLIVIGKPEASSSESSCFDFPPDPLQVIISSLADIGVHLERLEEDGWWINRGRDGHEMFVFLTDAEATAFLTMPEVARPGYLGWGRPPEEAYLSVSLVNLEEELYCGEGLPRFLVFDNGEMIIIGKPEISFSTDFNPGECAWFAFPPHQK